MKIKRQRESQVHKQGGGGEKGGWKEEKVMKGVSLASVNAVSVITVTM